MIEKLNILLFFAKFSVAQLTGTIRFKQHLIENMIVRSYKRKMTKLELHKLIQARIQMLETLRENDYKQYEWLLERLDLQFKPKPTKENQIFIARKEGLRQLTKAYCDDVRNQKLNAYREELEKQQLPFLEQKLKNLQFIRDEQYALKVPVTISQEKIDEVKKQYETMKAEYEANKEAPTKKKWKIY